MTIQKEIYGIASYSLFGKLSNRMDIKDVITSFIDSIIAEKISDFYYGVSDFEVRVWLEDEFMFSLPHSIVNQCLRKMECLDKRDGKYYLRKEHATDMTSLKKELETEVDSNDHFMNDVYIYIEKTSNKNLSMHDKQEIAKNVYTFILEQGLEKEYVTNKYDQYISAFIIEHGAVRYSEQIRAIKEGAILLTGLAHNNSVIRQKKWIEPFSIYIEMEEFFNLAGYNGTIFQEVAKDTFSLISEINKSHKVIYLKCFNDVSESINQYFETAADLLEKNLAYTANTTAMKTILAGCRTTSDVIDKQVQFEDLLDSYDIEFVDLKDIVENKEFNMSSGERINDLKIEDPKILDKITQINIIRKNQLFYDFTKSKSIILTEWSKLIYASNNIIQMEAEGRPLSPDKNRNHLTLDEQKPVPYHATMYYLSARLWYDLNKGFGNNGLPKSLDVVSKARIIMADRLQEKLEPEFDKAIQKLNSGEWSSEKAEKAIAIMKSRSFRPEDVNENNVSEIVEVLSADNIDFETQKLFAIEQENKKMREREDTMRAREDSLLNSVTSSNLESEKLSARLGAADSEIKQQDNILSELYNNEIKKCEDAKAKAVLLLRFLVVLVLILGFVLSYRYLPSEVLEIFRDSIQIAIISIGIFGVSGMLLLRVIEKRIGKYFYNKRYSQINTTILDYIDARNAID